MRVPSGADYVISATRAASSSSATVTNIDSLAFVEANDGKGGASYGTAFCISSTDRESYFLTAYHVVKGSVSITLKLEDSQLHNFYTPPALRDYPLDRTVTKGQLIDYSDRDLESSPF